MSWEVVAVIAWAFDTNIGLDLHILEKFVDEANTLGYEVFINYTSAGYNSMDYFSEI